MRLPTGHESSLRNELMSRKLEFYIALMGLQGELRTAFESLTELDSFDARARELAVQWRQELRPRCGDNLLCRQHLTARELLHAISRGLDKPGCYALAAALSLALTDRAQEIVESLDREEMVEARDN